MPSRLRSAGARAVTSALVFALAAGQAPRLAAAGNDVDAGMWRMIVMTSPAQIPVAQPASTASAEYQTELTAIKNAQGQITRVQQQAIDYWSGGGVLRWNQLLLEMVSRSDLPPPPNPDGTYPAPDAANPFAEPMFPFANPPYASRAYSYVAVAQFEALKAAWHFKYLYNRAAPSDVDRGVQALLPTNGLPSYPSEDAVVSGVTAELLKLLFPTNIEEITRKAAEQRQVAILTGRATASDVAAGLALGNAVAALFTARAGADGMRTAAGSPALFAALAAAATARGEIPWRSMELPPRPPMLAAFGSVRAWMMTPADIVNERPPAPPSTSSALMAREVDEVRQAVRKPTREQIALVYKWADGLSSPTPPGHWNVIATPYIAGAGFSEVRVARSFALLNMALHDAAVACWDTKFTYYNPRPSQMDSRIRTIIGLPNFPSYTSGHSTYSASAAEVLSYLFPAGATEFHQQKDEAAISRLYGGIHYRSDIEIGKTHGARVGGYTVSFARTDGADLVR
jgi:membrane-associated phospholipid phosphatase